MINLNSIKKKYQDNQKITALTAYDYSTAKTLDNAGIDIILAGDSLAMVALGYETTHNITMEEMIIFTKAVSRGTKNAFLVADMPFLSYGTDIAESIKNAGRFVKEGGAKAVKIEGASEHILHTIRRIVEIGVPVMGHIGFTPQFLNVLGGYNVQGKTLESAEEMLEQAQKIEEAGAFAVVLEMTPEIVAKRITENINIPTIGIGAGKFCSGQILVTDDILGKYEDFSPKFARKYANIASLIKEATGSYIKDVKEGSFPSEKESFQVDIEGF